MNFVGSPDFMLFNLCLHAFGQYQTNEVILWDRPDSCLLLCFTRVGAISAQRAASVGSPEVMFSIVFYVP